MKYISRCIRSDSAVIYAIKLGEKHKLRFCVAWQRTNRNYLASPWWLNLTALRDSNKSESSGWAKQAQAALPSVHCLRSTKYAREEWVAADVAPADDTTLVVKAAFSIFSPDGESTASNLSVTQCCWPLWSRWMQRAAQTLEAAEGAVKLLIWLLFWGFKRP